MRRALDRKGYAESRRTAIMCATLLPLGVFIVALPFIPLMARKTALAGAGVTNKFVVAVAVVVMFILAIAVPVVTGRISESNKQKAIYARETAEKDRVLGSQYQLVKTIQTASEPYHNLEFTFTGAGTDGPLISSLMSDLQKSGYTLSSRKNWDLDGENDVIACNRGADWQCTFDATGLTRTGCPSTLRCRLAPFRHQGPKPVPLLTRLL